MLDVKECAVDRSRVVVHIRPFKLYKILEQIRAKQWLNDFMLCASYARLVAGGMIVSEMIGRQADFAYAGDFGSSAFLNIGGEFSRRFTFTTLHTTKSIVVVSLRTTNQRAHPQSQQTHQQVNVCQATRKPTPPNHY